MINPALRAQNAPEAKNRDKYIIERLRASSATVSGESIARELELSRVALWKRIEALKARGYSIASSSQGYALERDDGLAAWDIDVPGEAFLYGEVGSTMDEARTKALSGAPSGSVALANSQSAGRGRSGRSWFSPRGGFYATVILRAELPVSCSGLLVLETALALIEALSRCSLEPVHFRWPNDIMAGRGKLGGIIVESAGALDRPDFYLVGIGLNFSRVDVDGRTTAGLAELAMDIPRRANVAGMIAASLQEWAGNLPSSSSSAWRRQGLGSSTGTAGRWDALLPDRSIKVSARLWNGIHAGGLPHGFGDRGELLLDGGRIALHGAECVKLEYQGEA